MLTVALVDFLQTQAARDCLDDLRAQPLKETDVLPTLARLRKHFAADEAGALLETARLRQKAAAKFGAHAHALLYTADALEQASHPAARRFRAAQLPQGTRRVLDVCCGIGADSLAYAQAGYDVLGLDNDPVRVAIAQHNAAALGLNNARFAVVDVTQGVPDDYDALFFDPARRDDDGRRLFDVAQYQPPLAYLHSWHAPYKHAKLAPSVELAQVAAYSGEVLFLSYGGELKEAVLMLGGGAQAGARTAVRLTDDGAHVWRCADPAAALAQTATLAAPRGWLCEPDPAILRAGLVRPLAEALGGALLDESIAYFCTPHAPDSVWVRAWQILDVLAFNVKGLRAYLRGHNVGRVTVKKRGSPLTPETLIPQLKLKGDETRTLVLTRHAQQPIVLVCTP